MSTSPPSTRAHSGCDPDAVAVLTQPVLSESARSWSTASARTWAQTRAARGVELERSDVPVRLGDDDVELALPVGRTVVPNASSRAELLRPGTPPLPVERYVVTAQAALAPVDGAVPAFGPATAWVPASPGSPAPYLAAFAPFADPHTPDAAWYGATTMAISRVQLDEVGAEELLRRAAERLAAYEHGAGLREVDPDTTRAAAIVPVVRDSARRTDALLRDGRPIIDVHRAFSPGAPAINVDGMLASVIGADAFATAFLDAQTGATDPVAAARSALSRADRAMRPVRARNHESRS